ncbi:MAG TPA: helix-turn-helix domain-containing protein [Allosphingosinicella sp.]|uniref:winged helix-turn-helix transcriptional regulator n=1 Tax=Allosphingosinicella sp. TaxID=2823234 RepID=UPI002ED86C13
MSQLAQTPLKSPDDIKLCPAIGFGRIVGGKYKLRILWLLHKRPHRYGELRTALLKGSLSAAVTPRILSRELKELQERGLISRKQYEMVPPKVEYSITDRGRGLVPVIEAIIAWGLTGVHEEILGISSSPDDTED